MTPLPSPSAAERAPVLDSSCLGVAEVAQPVRERVEITLARQAAVGRFVALHDASFDALIAAIGRPAHSKVAEWGDA